MEPTRSTTNSTVAARRDLATDDAAYAPVESHQPEDTSWPSDAQAKSSRAGSPSRGGESGGFLGQLGLYETGSASVGPFGIVLAIGLAVLTYPFFWLVRMLRRRVSR